MPEKHIHTSLSSAPVFQSYASSQLVSYDVFHSRSSSFGLEKCQYERECVKQRTVSVERLMKEEIKR